MYTARRALFFMLLAAAATVVSAQTVFVEDHFTGTNGTTLQAHAPDTGGTWAHVSGSNLNIQSNTLRGVSNNGNDHYTNATSAPSADYVVGMDVTFSNPSGNNFVELLGRSDATAQNCYLAQFASNGSVGVWPVVGGTVGTAIISTTVTVTQNVQHYVVLEMIGNQISVWVDGVQAGLATNNAITAAGEPGLGLNSVGANQTIGDDFFAGTFGVTEARMQTMAARRHGGRALVEWTTGREVANLGFRVWRQDGTRRTRVTPSLIAGSAFLTNATLTAGNHYRWVDPKAKPRSRYWIESIGVDGRSEWNGPVVPLSVDDEQDSLFLASDDGQGCRSSTAKGHACLSSTLLRDVTPAQTNPGRTIAANDMRRAAAPPDTLAKGQQLAAGAAVKISVDADGWYRVTRSELLAAGLDAAADPHRLHLYTDALEVAMTVEGEAEGRVDAIRFYGTALDTLSTATRVYWLATEEGAGRRIATGPSSTNGPVPASFLVTAERRDKVIFFAALANGENESFFGPVITNDPTQPAIQTLRLSHIDRTAPTAEVEIALQGVGDGGESAGHDVAVTLNGQPLEDIRFNGREALSIHRIVPLNLLADGDNTLAFTAKNGDSDVSLVSYVRITYAHTYDLDDDALTLTSGGGDMAVRGAAQGLYALDVTGPAAPLELPVTIDNGIAHLTAPTGARRTIVVTSHFAQAARVEANHPSSLHAATGADMVIIVHPSLLPAVEPLRALRASQGLSVLVAPVDDIYDEYGYGAKDPAAIRRFLADTRRWTTKPRYVLLVGDASLDPRNYLGLGDFDLVPTKLIATAQLKTSSDWWLVDFDDDSFGDIAIGRLPARTLADAQLEIGKIVAYENAPAAPDWAKSALLVTGSDSARQFDAMTNAVRAAVPAGYTTDAIAAGGSGEGAARQDLLGRLDQGALLVNYVGHGSVDLWSDLFAGSDALSLHNGGRLPFVVAMTCLNGFFHDVSQPSLAEELLAAPEGGAVGVFASSSLTDPLAQSAANQELVRALLADHATFGDAALAAQRRATDANVRRTFLLFGDPAMRLKQ